MSGFQRQADSGRNRARPRTTGARSGASGAAIQPATAGNRALSRAMRAARSSAGSPAAGPRRAETLRYHVLVRGHASPRWRRPGASTAEQLNLDLSERRARLVAQAVRRMIAAHNGEVRTTGSTQWGGVTSTLAEADGDLDANAPEMRRVDILVDVHERSLASGPFTESAPGTGLSRCWSINVDVIDAVAGAAGTIGLGEIRNLETNQSVEGRWLAGGGGAGFDLPVLPSVSPGAWTGFETISPQSLSTFEGCPIRFSAFSAGLGAGYGIGYLRFIGITDEPIVLRGLAINQWGAGGSVTAGVWHFTEGIPEPP